MTTHRCTPPVLGVGGRYVINSILGHGESADVFGATDRLLGRSVALKWLRPDPGGDAQQRLGAQARRLAALDHPGLLRVFDTGVEDGRPYVVMECAGITTLAQLQQAGVLLPDAVATIGAQLAGALAYLHSFGLVHGALDAANVRVELPDGDHERVWLSDWDFRPPQPSLGLTPAADVLALGTLLRACLPEAASQALTVGEPTPAPGHRSERDLAQAARRPVTPLSSPAWMGLLGAMVSADPAARPSAEQVADELRTASRLAALTRVLSGSARQARRGDGRTQPERRNSTQHAVPVGAPSHGAPSLGGPLTGRTRPAVRENGRRARSRTAAMTVGVAAGLLVITSATTLTLASQAGGQDRHPTAAPSSDGAGRGSSPERLATRISPAANAAALRTVGSGPRLNVALVAVAATRSVRLPTQHANPPGAGGRHARHRRHHHVGRGHHHAASPVSVRPVGRQS